MLRLGGRGGLGRRTEREGVGGGGIKDGGKARILWTVAPFGFL